MLIIATTGIHLAQGTTLAKYSRYTNLRAALTLTLTLSVHFQSVETLTQSQFSPG